MSIDFLSLDDLLEIGARIVPELAIRDLGLLESAAARPRTTVFGEDAYPEFADKVAALMHSIARNHALVDGNKRLAWSAARTFCLLNSCDLVIDVDDAERLVLDTSQGSIEVPELARVIREHLRKSPD